MPSKGEAFRSIQDHDGNSAGARVLLVLEVAVRRDEDLEPSRLCRSDQQPILER